MSTNVFVKKLDLIAPNVMDERRLEVVAEGLPLHGGAQLVIDTTLVSALRKDGAEMLRQPWRSRLRTVRWKLRLRSKQHSPDPPGFEPHSENWMVDVPTMFAKRGV